MRTTIPVVLVILCLFLHQTATGGEMNSYTFLLHHEVFTRAGQYLEALRNGEKPGAFLAANLAQTDLVQLTSEEFIEKLLQTKKPMIFAESAVKGDGSDWTMTELSILGYVSAAVPVTVYDDGLHQSPNVHAAPFAGTLLFVPGALLDTGSEKMPPADWDAVVSNGHIEAEAFYRFYEKRFLPAFFYADRAAAANGRQALITIPGVGCGMFAGPFKGSLGVELEKVLFRFLHQHGRSFANVRAVYYGPYKECSNARHEINGVSLLVRPFLNTGKPRPQLCRPAAYGEADDNFSDCEFFSVVAWDHVSWPGNDYFGGSRSTDDGVKAAATSSMQTMTGITGRYDAAKFCYLPPDGFRNWGEVVAKNCLQLKVRGRLRVFPE